MTLINGLLPPKSNAGTMWTIRASPLLLYLDAESAKILSHILKFAQPHLGSRERSFSMSNSKACVQVGRARKYQRVGLPIRKLHPLTLFSVPYGFIEHHL